MINAIGVYTFNQKIKDAKVTLFAQQEKDTTANYQLHNLEETSLPQFLQEDNFYFEKKYEREYHFLLKEFNSGIILAIVSRSYIGEEISNLFVNIKRVYWAHNASKTKKTDNLLKTNLTSIIENPQGYIGKNARLELTNGASFTLDHIIENPEYFSDDDIRVKQIKAVIAEVKEITLDNIDRLIERKEKLDALVEKSQLISEHTTKFHKAAKDLNRCRC